MVHLRQEPPFQSKRHFAVNQAHNMNQMRQHTGTDPNQDDFFIIGPSDCKFAPSVAYRNRLKYRSRSTSPRAVNIGQDRKRPVTAAGRTIKHAEERPVTDDRAHQPRPPPIKRAHTVHPRRNEAVQTEAPRKALEAEIQRIRADLERRKQQLRAPRTHAVHPTTSTTKPAGLRPSEKPQPQQPPRNQSPEKKVEFTPNAPRQQDPVVPARAAPRDRRERSLSPTGQIRHTEYQRAYRAPEPARPTKSAQALRAIAVAPTRTDGDAPTHYESEYQREYKPFKYVPVDQLKSTCVQAGDRIHIVPIPRPRSAFHLRAADVKSNSAQAGTATNTTRKPKLRSLTPPPDGRNPRKRRHYLTEYAAKYKNFFGFSQPGSRSQSPNAPLQHTWQTEWDELQRQAELYRERDRSSHFTPDHLAQLESACVDAWDPPSSEQSAKNQQKWKMQLTMPPAGKPSLSPTSQMRSQPDCCSADLRRLAMYDSHHVAEILDPDDPWDCSSSESCLYETHQPRERQQPNQMRHTGFGQAQQECRLCSMLPQGQITRDSGPVAHSLSYQTEPMSRNSSLYRELGNSHAMRSTPYEEERADRAHKSPISTTLDVDPTEAFSTPSPLSARSMASSASMASETLERARRQRDRVFDEYEKQRSTVYSPHTYSGPSLNYYRTNKNRRTCYS